MEGLLGNPETRIDAFLAAGHVCTIMGEAEYEKLVENYRIPIAITGFEPVDILEGLRSCIDMLETGTVALKNQYKRSVRANGNPAAQQALKEVFEVKDQRWRGLGELVRSGLGLNEKYRDYDAARKFQLRADPGQEAINCISGEILMGLKKPTDCPEFCKSCHPQNPLGATMVSEEGACHAYYLYKKRGENNHERHGVRLPI
jgi:hydrogenase expression/formation protein HypD